MSIIKLDFESENSDPVAAVRELIASFRSGEPLTFYVLKADEADEADFISADIFGNVE